MGRLPRDRVSRRRASVFIQSRDLRPLDRYFPELHELFLRTLPDGCVVDGEIVIATPRGPRLRRAADAAASGRLARREAGEGDAGGVRRLRSARGRRAGPAERRRRCERRAQLEALLAQRRAAAPPHAGDARSRRWPRSGSSASRAPVSTASSRSRSTGRTSRASARCSRSSTRARPTASSPASAGTRADDDAVGSLLLGLYDAKGRLHHVGVTSSFTMARRQRARDRAGATARACARRSSLARMGRSRTASTGACPAGRAGGAPARISRGSRCASSGSARSSTTTCRDDRFRHAAVFLRWRPDKPPGRLPLRPARGHDSLRAREGLRRPGPPALIHAS